jgi:hypothetical protein
MTTDKTIPSPATPGPWRANGQTVFDCDGDEICTCGECVADRHNADARLIAAAPELLAACEAALLREDVADGELGDLLRKAVECARVGGFPQPSPNGEWRRVPQSHVSSVWRHPPATRAECLKFEHFVRWSFVDCEDAGTPICPECGRDLELAFVEVCDGKENAHETEA